MRPDPETHRIGWVAGVESERLEVELDPATTASLRAGRREFFRLDRSTPTSPYQ